MGSNASEMKSITVNEREVRLNQSKIFFHTDRSTESNAVISAIKVRGFDSEDYQGKKIKKFNISIDVEEN